MTSLKRTAAVVAAPLLLALSLSACGGGNSTAGEDSPKGASVSDFCTAFISIEQLGNEVGDDDTSAQVDAAHQYADKLAAVGTPDDMTDDQRAGFEAYVDFFKNVDESQAKDIGDSDADFEEVFGDDKAKVEALQTYITSNCADALTSAIPTDGAS